MINTSKALKRHYQSHVPIARTCGRDGKNFCQGVSEQGGEGGREEKKGNCRVFPVTRK